MICAGLNQTRLKRAGWRVNGWVKKGILVGFRLGGIVDMSVNAVRQPFLDKSTYPVRQVTPADGIRIVPGGSKVFATVIIGRGVTCMPPMYINVGALRGATAPWWIPHALIGSLAQQIGLNPLTFRRSVADRAAFWSRLARCR